MGSAVIGPPGPNISMVTLQWDFTMEEFRMGGSGNSPKGEEPGDLWAEVPPQWGPKSISWGRKMKQTEAKC